MKLSEQPLRRQMLCASVLVVLTLVVAIAWAARTLYAERSAELREQAASTAFTARAYLEERIAHVDSLAAALRLHPAVRASRIEACDALFGELLQQFRFIHNITLTDRQGRNRGSGLPRPRPFDVGRERRHVRRVLETGRPFVGEFDVGAVSGQARLILAFPVPNEAGEVGGVLGIAIWLDRFSETFAAIPLPPGSVLTLTDRRGRILARSAELPKYLGHLTQDRIGTPPRAPAVQTGMDVDGVERIVGRALIERGPWMVSVGIPTAVALTRILPAYRRHMVILLLSFVLSAGFGVIIARTVARPLRDLESAAARIARGDYRAPLAVRATGREVSRLRAAFVLMASDLEQTHAALDRQIDEERRMRAKLASLQRQAVRQERLAAVGQLVSGVAHEVNNPLQAIVGATELIDARERLSEQAREDLRLIRSESGRARDIIRNLLRFAGQQPTPPEPVHPADVVGSVVQLRRRSMESAGIAVEVDVRSNRPVRAVFSELQQVLLNFVVNAEQAIQTGHRTGARLRITCYERADVIRIEVADSGPGVAAENEQKLFQPFFTTKPVGQGTGLGLSVSYGIIESYGGEIGYETNAWGGATFYFELPLAGKAVMA